MATKKHDTEFRCAVSDFDKDLGLLTNHTSPTQQILGHEEKVDIARIGPKPSIKRDLKMSLACEHSNIHLEVTDVLEVS